MQPAIRTINLTKQYHTKTVVNQISLTIPKGELFGLLGVNGAGKTTLIKMLSCLISPTSGEAYLMENSILEQPNQVKGCIAVSPQETAIAPNLSVRENLELMAGAHRFNKETIKKKTDEMLKLFLLWDIQKQRSKTLSGGWQRRLSIAMALISEPQILFLDEPTLGLDVLGRRELWHVIRELKGKITIVLTTHYLEEAEALSDRIGVMRDGHMKALGTAEELKQQTNSNRFEDAFIKLIETGEHI